MAGKTVSCVAVLRCRVSGCLGQKAVWEGFQRMGEGSRGTSENRARRQYSKSGCWKSKFVIVIVIMMLICSILNIVLVFCLQILSYMYVNYVSCPSNAVTVYLFIMSSMICLVSLNLTGCVQSILCVDSLMDILVHQSGTFFVIWYFGCCIDCIVFFLVCLSVCLYTLLCE